MNVKSARILLGAAMAVYLLWVGGLIAMASTRQSDPAIEPSGRRRPSCSG